MLRVITKQFIQTCFESILMKLGPVTCRFLQFVFYVLHVFTVTLARCLNELQSVIMLALWSALLEALI